MLRLLAMLAMAPVTFAAEPKRLSPEDIDAGMIQLFDGESTFGWKVDGDSSIKDGVWSLGGGKETTAAFQIELPPCGYRLSSRITRGKAVPALFSSATGKSELNIVYDNEDGFLSQTEPNRGQPRQLRIVVPAGAKLEIREFAARLFKPAPIFNGKDLTGWKVHDEPKKNASKFEVSKDGELRVTNGPGDLQTTGKYSDFLLQFQCKTNGDGLNSGIFFRCIEGQYQNGYECQIQNAMVDNDPTKPKDFGTGAIYRRIPARKIVAKDKEWFSVTLVARGDQFATWVNGYPVMQWKDERPADDNPRKGLRKAAGHLSIQGHDPTTDILFRKLAVAEYPAAK